MTERWRRTTSSLSNLRRIGPFCYQVSRDLPPSYLKKTKKMLVEVGDAVEEVDHLATMAVAVVVLDTRTGEALLVTVGLEATTGVLMAQRNTTPPMGDQIAGHISSSLMDSSRILAIRDTISGEATLHKAVRRTKDTIIINRVHLIVVAAVALLVADIRTMGRITIILSAGTTVKEGMAVVEEVELMVGTTKEDMTRVDMIKVGTARETATKEGATEATTTPTLMVVITPLRVNREHTRTDRIVILVENITHAAVVAGGEFAALTVSFPSMSHSCSIAQCSFAWSFIVH